MPRGRDPGVTRKKIIDTGFRLYTERTIESVAFQQIADESGVSMPTITRHFPRKQDLVIAIGTEMWSRFWAKLEQERPAESLPEVSAAQRMEFFLDQFIRLFETQPELLRFNAGFDSYVQKEMPTGEQMKAYYESVEPIRKRFSWLYAKALEDGTMRTDIPEGQLFFATLYAMLSAAGRYACGTIWPSKSREDCLNALMILKKMIMEYCTR